MYALSTVSKQFLVIFQYLFASKIIPLVAYKILVLCMIMQKTEIGFMKILSMNDLKMEKMNQQDILSCHEDLCASYQEAAVDQLVRKCSRFLNSRNYKSFGLSGGVANNEILRERFKYACDGKGLQFLAADKKHTGDNAAMVAYVAHQDCKALWPNENGDLTFNPSLSLDEVPCLN